MKNSRRKRKLSTVGILTVLVIVLLLLAGAGLFVKLTYNKMLSAVDPDSQGAVLIDIEPDDTIKKVAERLENIGLIRNAEVFILAARLNDKMDVCEGVYSISTQMDGWTILNVITDPALALEDQVIVTLIEGYWAKDSAAAIAEKCDISAQALLEKWNDADFIAELSDEYWFITPDLVDKNKRIALEGYLYPSTYYFYKDAGAAGITYKLLDAFEARIEPLKADIEKSSLSLDEIITLASIVQYEAGGVDDMAAVAGVFMNRLNKGMRLESCATICYVLYNYNDRSECQAYKSQQIASPYNTYLNEGLPLGPILNPSLAAIEATLHYDHSDYLFFLHDKKGNIHLAADYNTHLANVSKYLESNE